MVMTYKSQLFPLLQILYPHLKLSGMVKENLEKPWKEFLLSYHKSLTEEGKIKNAKFCERFWILKK